MTKPTIPLLTAAGAALCCLLNMCTDNDQKLSDVALIVQPGAETCVTVHASEKTLYDISLTTANDYVASLTITAFDPRQGLSVCLDTICGTKKFEHSFTFTAPELNRDTAEVVLTFSAADNHGNRASVKRSITVINPAMLPPAAPADTTANA